jgi:hypothetical protein
MVSAQAVPSGGPGLVSVSDNSVGVSLAPRIQALFAATGWSKAAQPADAVISGTLTRHFPDGDRSSSMTIRLRGESQYDYVEGDTHVVVSGVTGAVRDSGGKTRRMPAQTALNGGLLLLPMSSLLFDWNSPGVQLQLIGEAQVGGETCAGIQLVRAPQSSSKDVLAGSRKGDTPLTVWVSLSRGLPLRADYYRVAADNHTAKIRETALFSDYRVVRGMLLPFRQDVLIEGYLTYTYDFTSVQLNQGLTDSDFNVAAVAGGAQ